MTLSLKMKPTATRDQSGDALGPIARTLFIVAALWIVSSQGYYALVDALGLENGYDGAPILFTGYYLGWAGVAAWLFRSLFNDVLDRDRLTREGLALLPILAGFAVFVVYVLPLLPKVSEVRAPANPPEFMFASAWYYLPKSADILFQQVLISALILTGVRAGLGLGAMSLGMAATFGLFHLGLAFDGFLWLYVARFTLAATLFGALLPYLYLRMRSGFRWAYSLHWSFYAADAVLTHLLLAAPPWA
ncbi:hypothetical protein [Tropicibacter oceani]|uniref:CPBP family intramembrane metalloprotease n=1 Tax=Tropicibacter oceani TaxID=3058420 RepID=A0ABY8QHJ0_9RHOB|nr:hypothetical protein [Tropicibacter oceani]WGW04117.1 hypothetical protein QF118_00840 [Tropicibacter oceani]